MNDAPEPNKARRRSRGLAILAALPLLPAFFLFESTGVAQALCATAIVLSVGAIVGIAISPHRLGGIEVSVGAIAVSVVGLFLLQAMHEARDAANRSKAACQLKASGVANHNFLDAEGSFPVGTSREGAAAGLAVDERLSFLADLLPFLGERGLHDQLEFSEPWDGPTNGKVTSLHQRHWVHSSLPSRYHESNVTSYVGVAGVGPDCARLPADDPRAGVYGYDRGTTIDDIADGMATTMMMAGVQADLGPWGQGGHSTVRGFTTEPYLYGPDGFGSPASRRGLRVLMCDGSIHFLCADVDPEVIRAFATVSGGEEVAEP